jgi:CheY-like chemotaxis protein
VPALGNAGWAGFVLGGAWAELPKDDELVIQRNAGGKPHAAIQGSMIADPAAILPVSILLVDDEPTIHFVVGVILREAGYSVGDANDGMEGLRMFEKGSWDLVITDRAMPGMGGEQLAREIKNISPDVPLLLLTGFLKADTRFELFDEILEKPFLRAKLLATVGRVLDTRHVASMC